MNDNELDLALRAMGQRRTAVVDPPELHELVRSTAATALQGSSILPPLTERFRSPFSALKLVAAGVIVALFGGFLLAGVLTTPLESDVPPAAVSASPTTEAEPDATAASTEPTVPREPVVRTDILTGVELTVEEVEPGIFQVLSDGVRDISPGDWSAIHAGHDDGVWVREQYQFFRLGTADVFDYPKERSWPLFHVAPDGTVWTLDYGEEQMTIRSFDGDSWKTQKRVKASGYSTGEGSSCSPNEAMDVAPDGTVWAAWPDPNAIAKNRKGEYASVIARLGVDDWERLDPLLLADTPCAGVIAGPGGGVWADGLRHVDGGWLPVASDGLLDGFLWSYHVSPDGTVRGARTSPLIEGGEYVTNEYGQVAYTVDLMRFDGSRWDPVGSSRVWDDEDADNAFAMVAPDGSAWIESSAFDALGGSASLDGVLVRGGVARFDGRTWQRYLTDHHIHHMDIAPDGSVWVRAVAAAEFPMEPWYGGIPRPALPRVVDTYVITPEAVAATG